MACAACKAHRQAIKGAVRSGDPKLVAQETAKAVTTMVKKSTKEWLVRGRFKRW